MTLCPGSLRFGYCYTETRNNYISSRNYYNKNIDQLENVYQIKKKKSKKEEQKPATSNIDLQQYDEKDLPSSCENGR